MKKSTLLLGSAMLTLFFVSCSKKDKKTDDDITPPPVAIADTLIGEVSGTLKSGSKIYLLGDIVVPEGKSLLIEPGVILTMNPAVKPEIIVKGNFYAEGTAAAPILFTSPAAGSATFGDQWGGILAGPTCQELLLNYVVLEQGGAVTTEESASLKAGFYKAEAGEHVPALWYGGSGNLVIANSTIRNFNEDVFYIEGGNVIISNNYFYTTGVSGGEAINIKSGVLADVAFNVVYSPNTNAMKLSNAGDRPRQAHVIGYNNTLVNCGWRRPTAKGGGIWIEKSVRVELYNNLMVNNRFGIKRDEGSPEDNRSVFAKTYYYGYTQQCVDQFQPSADIASGTGDVRGTTAGEHDPKLVNYSLSTDVNEATYNTAWDFHLQAGSPALTGGKTDFTRHFTTGLTLNGKSYASPAPVAYIGALGAK